MPSPTPQSLLIGQQAEAKVFAALAGLPAPWQVFQTVEWRRLVSDGERVGEADAVVFHPQHGLVVLEVKSGAVEVRDGLWYYASGNAMKQSPFSQARRNRYALLDKLSRRLGSGALESLTVTHAAWFPDVVWQGILPGAEVPSRAFLLDRSNLADSEPALLRLLHEAGPQPQAWTQSQQRAVKELLAPDCRCLVPLAGKVDAALGVMHSATQDQMAVLRMLRAQPRLLVSATDLTLGSSFEFTWHQFSLICSDLGSVPLSFAVAASSAVPLALSPMTLKNYSNGCRQPGVSRKNAGPGDYRVRLLQDSQRSYLDAGLRPYIHLVDGGLADNLGLRSLLDRSRADGSLRDSVRRSASTKIHKLVIIAVNAERDPSERIDASDWVPSTMQVIDALLFGTGARATQETLGLLSDTTQAWRRELRLADAQADDPFAADAQIHLVNVNLRDAPELLGRRLLLQIPTAFSLPQDDVSRLIAAGRSILLESPEFKALLKSLAAVPPLP